MRNDDEQSTPPPPPRRGVFSPEQFSSIARGEQLPLFHNSSDPMSPLHQSSDLHAVSESSDILHHRASSELLNASGELEGIAEGGATTTALNGALRGGGRLGGVSMLSSVLSDGSASVTSSNNGAGGGPRHAQQQAEGSAMGRLRSVTASAETILVSHRAPPGASRPLRKDGGAAPPMSPLEQQPDEDSAATPSRGGGTVFQTSLNIAKTCMGTGTLALPYAACQGGLLFSLIGLGLISLWNLYSIDRLLKCLELVPPVDDDDSDDEDDDALGKDEEGGIEVSGITGNGEARGTRNSAGEQPGQGGRRRTGKSSRHSSCSRHKRTGSSMRKLFSRLMSDRVIIGVAAADLNGENGVDGKELLLPPATAMPPSLQVGDTAASADRGYGSVGAQNTESAAAAAPSLPTEPPLAATRARARRTSRPPPGTATYGRVAYHAFGPSGLHVLDAVMTILLMGIIVAYECAIMSFLAPTPLSTIHLGGSAVLDALLWTAAVIAPLSCVPDMGYLGKFSACGIAAVLATFVGIFWYGLAENGVSGLGMISWSDLWPRGGFWGVEGMSRWFGVAAFGYGVVPITYNIRESMSEPSRMGRATEMALLLVYAVYALISTGVAIVYRPFTGAEGFEGDVMQALPVGWIPTAIRLAMTFVVLVTAPLLVVPCAQLVEGKLGISGSNVSREQSTSQSFVRRHAKVLGVAIRYAICFLCIGVSIAVPGFVNVLSFVGAFCVALTSFVFPPLLHLTLLRRRRAEDEYNAAVSSLTKAREAPVFRADAATEKELRRFDSPREPEEKKAVSARSIEAVHLRQTVRVDIALLIWGAAATAVTSFLTFTDLFRGNDVGAS